MQIINSKYILAFILILANLANFQNSFAAEYRVSSASELKNLSLAPGDVVTMTNGTWTNQELSFKGNGTASQPIVLRAETQGEVILTGDSRLSIAGEYLVINGLVFKDGALDGDPVVQFRTSSSSLANHCRLTNTKIIDYNPSDPTVEYKWVSLYGEYNQVDHCSFVGKNHQGAMMVVWLSGNPNHHRINNNYFADIPDLGQNGGETIRIGTSTNSMTDSYTIVENNLFEACDGEIEIISNKSCENIYRYNTFLHCEGMLTLRHGNRCEVYSNFFFGDVNKRSAGVRIIGDDHKVYNNYFQDLMSDGFRSAICLTNGVPDSPLNRYFQVINAEVVNNTIVNCQSPITIGAGKSDELSLPPKNTNFTNNVIADYAGVTSKAVHYEDVPDGITYTNNIIYAPSNLGDTPDEIDNSDPKLEVSDDFYRLASSSPAIGFGITSVSYLNYDIDGQERTSINDAGCDQVSSADIINKPLSPDDIGVLIGVVEDSTDNGGGEGGNWKIYEASLDPVTFGFSESSDLFGGEKAMPIDDADNAGNKVLDFSTVDTITTKLSFSYSLSIDQSKGFTVVMRAKAKSVSHDMIELTLKSGVSYEKIRFYPDKGELNVEKGTADTRKVSYPMPEGLDMLDWNVYRFTIVGSTLNMWVNDIQVGDDIVTNYSPTTTTNFGFGEGNTNFTYDSYVDWVIWDETGAYGPGEGSEYPSALIVEPLGNGETALRENNTVEYTVYPNPNDGIFTVENALGANVQVLTLSGQVVFENSGISAKEQISLDLESGIYLLNIDDTVSKIIIK